MLEKIKSIVPVPRFLRNPDRRAVTFAALGFGLNLAYALYHAVLSILSQSLWMLVLSGYYTLLSMMRLAAVLRERRSRHEEAPSSERFLMCFLGVTLLLLSGILALSVYLSFRFDVAVVHSEIVMITIAAYTFYKITLSIINEVKARKRKQSLLVAIRNINCGDAAASLLTLQRSMLVSFDGMTAQEIGLFNALTGGGVCLVVAVLGISMIVQRKRGRPFDGKKNLIKANEKIASHVTDAFQKIQDTVVGGYSKIEDKFVTQYLMKEGETVAEAKERLKKEHPLQK